MQHYSHHGINFSYPEHWTLEEDHMETAEGSLVLSHDESGAFWTLQKYPAGTNPEVVIWEAVATMQSEYADIECDRFEKKIAGKSVIGFEMTFFFLDMMNVAMVICFEQSGQIISVFWQTSNQQIVVDGKKVSPEKTMESITRSLLREGQ
jgi:hypothetical protein